MRSEASDTPSASTAADLAAATAASGRLCVTVAIDASGCGWMRCADAEVAFHCGSVQQRGRTGYSATLSSGSYVRILTYDADIRF